MLRFNHFVHSGTNSSLQLTLITTMTEQTSDHSYPQIFIFRSPKGKSGDKGELFASPVFFCPLRKRVKDNFNLYLLGLL